MPKCDRDARRRLPHQVNQRESLRRREGVRLLKRPSALLPPHAVLEHVLGSLRTPDFPTDGVGLQQVSAACLSGRAAAPSSCVCVFFLSLRRTIRRNMGKAGRGCVYHTWLTSSSSACRYSVRKRDRCGFEHDAVLLPSIIG